MPSILLYGGTFNPIHNGHLALCRDALCELNIDKALLMPSAIPPHKEAPHLAPERHRLAMCRVAVNSQKGLAVDSYELDKGGSSYTIDTLEHLHAVCPDTEIYLLMGTDMFLTFREWRRWQDIGALATLAVGSRQVNEQDRLIKMKLGLEADGISSVLLEHPVVEMSSTQIRSELAAKGTSELLPPEVMIYIRFHGLYGTQSPDGEPDEILEGLLERYICSLMSPKRYNHSVEVRRQAVHLARKYGADPKKAAVAGILHDICKDMDKGQMLQMLRESGIINSIDFGAQPQLIHSRVAPLYIARRLGIDDLEILDAVRYHTTARRGMTLLDQVIYLADLTSGERDYPDVKEMRRLTEISLEDAMAYALRFMVGRLTKKEQPVCPDTREAYEQYCTSDGGTG